MYLDSAILVKLLVPEPDSSFYAALVEGQEDLLTSELAIVECRSALVRKRRQKEIYAWVYDGALDRLQHLWPKGGELQFEPVTRSVLQEAGDIVQRCSKHAVVRSLDAIHIATCLRARADPLVTNDTVMRAAAAALGIPLGPLPA
jgi:predicted nucleic acid-binding protein